MSERSLTREEMPDMDYRFQDRCLTDIVAAVAVLEFDLDDLETLRRQKIPAEKKRGLRGHGSALLRRLIPRLKDAFSDDSIDRPDEGAIASHRGPAREDVPDKFIADFVVKAIDWFIEKKIAGASINLKSLFVACRVAREIVALDASIKNAAGFTQPKNFTFYPDAELHITWIMNRGRRSIILYFPPDAFGLARPGYAPDALPADGFISSEVDKKPGHYLLYKTIAIPDVINNLAYPDLCRNGLIIETLRDADSHATLRGISIRTTAPLNTFRLHYKPTGGTETEYISGEQGPVPEELSIVKKDGDRRVDIRLADFLRESGCRMGIELPSQGGSSKRAFFQAYAMPIDVSDPSQFMPFIRIRGTVIRQSSNIRRSSNEYRIDLEKERLFIIGADRNEKEVQKKDDEDTFEGADQINYIRKYPIEYESGTERINEDFYFCRSNGHYRVFSITSRARKVSFLRTFELNRTYVIADGVATRENIDDAAQEWHFRITNTGILHETQWKYSAAPSHTLDIFQLCTKPGEAVKGLVFQELIGGDWSTDVPNLNGFYFILTARSAYIFDLKRTPG